LKYKKEIRDILCVCKQLLKGLIQDLKKEQRTVDSYFPILLHGLNFSILKRNPNLFHEAYLSLPDNRLFIYERWISYLDPSDRDYLDVVVAKLRGQS